MSEYPLDEWVNWRWEIKWSRYEPGGSRTGLYSTTDAALTVYINKARRVQWTGKLGRCHFYPKFDRIHQLASVSYPI